MKKDVGYIYGGLMLVLSLILYSIAIGIAIFFAGIILSLIIPKASPFLLTSLGALIGFAGTFLISFYSVKRFVKGFKVADYVKLIIYVTIIFCLIDIGLKVISQTEFSIATIISSATDYVIFYVTALYSLKKNG